MLGILIELIVSWLLLWIFCRQGLTALGLVPNKNRLSQFAAGFIIAVLCITLYHVIAAALSDNRWQLNRQYTAGQFLSASWWTLKSVLYENLLFRGALLYILARKLNPTIACVISAVAFGIYHWFSYNVFGNPFMMTIVFIMTGIAGWIFAYAFVKTWSLYLPIGLHLGYNIVNIVVFSNASLGPQLLTKENDALLQGTWSIILTLFQVIAMPLITFWYLKKLRPVVE